MKKNLFQLAGPIFIEILLLMLLGVADIFMLSQFDDNAAGAVQISNQIIKNINIIFVIISSGTAVLIAQNVGADNKEEVERVSAVSLIINFIIGIMVSISMIIYGEEVLKILGMSSNLMKYAADYITIVGGALFFQSILTTLIRIIQSHGFTKQSMFISIIMNVINIIGDAIFIFGLFGAPVLGVKGVAIVTTFSRGLATLIAFFFVFKKLMPIKDTFVHITQKPIVAMKRLIMIGFPAAMENMSYGLYQTVMTGVILTNLGDIPSITRGYVWTIAWFVMIFSLAIGQANQIMIGQYIGEDKPEEAYNTGLKNFKIAMIFSVIGGIILFFYGRYFLEIYTDNPKIISLGASVLLVDAFLEPGRTFNVVLINGLRGAGDVIFPVIMAIISMWGIGLLGGYIFGVVLGFGLPGIWIGFLIDEWLRGICMLFRWRGKKWLNKSMVNNEELTT
ncbi:MAG: MATE family efflux transporter [Eubacteriales bacterium]